MQNRGLLLVLGFADLCFLFLILLFLKQIQFGIISVYSIYDICIVSALTTLFMQYAELFR